MQRVRISLPHFRTFGWDAQVLAVDADYQQDRLCEPELLDSLPVYVPVTRTRALPLGLTRRIGIGNVGLRAFGHLYRAGLRLIRQHDIDLVYFSTTMFPVMALGRLWKRRTAVPFVLDMQDPWLSDYLDAHPTGRPPKYTLARRLHAVLEPFTMRSVDAVIAVSEAYHRTLRERYPWIRPDMCETLPFGVSAKDFELAADRPWQNPFFDRQDGTVHAVYLGRGGQDIHTASMIFVRALKRCSLIAGVDPVRLWCIGTDYAPAGEGRKCVEPIAVKEGAADLVSETPDRIPYLSGLRLLQDADVIVILGSDDPSYQPSKIYPYLLTGRPLVAVLHEESPGVEAVERSGAGIVITFGGADDVGRAARRLAEQLPRLLDRLPFSPDVNAAVVAPYLAEEGARRQCAVFDRVMAVRARTLAVA
jgi:hypothetical protein